VLKRYVATAHGLIHCRCAGSGAPVVLLHPSPLSGAAMAPFADNLSDRFKVFCFDTPGYGQSDALTPRPTSLNAYVDALIGAWDALGIVRCALIGAATGAQIAIELAKRYPQRVALLIADSACHFDDLSRERILARYFPDLTPCDHGGHLAAAWQMSRDLFLAFPWFDASAAARLNRDIPPPSVVQSVLLDCLRAGPDYARAYRLAFLNERAAQVQPLKVPTLIPLWQSSILKRFTEALLAQPLTGNIQTLHIDAGAAARVAAIVAAVRARYSNGRADAEAATSTTSHRDYHSADWGQLHWRGDLRGSGTPLLLLHDAAESSGQLQALVDANLGVRPVIAFDLPGHGDSDLAANSNDASSHAEALGQALNALGIDQVECWGRFAGAQVALELAALKSINVSHLVHLGTLHLSPEQRSALKTQHAPAFDPEASGAHLLRAWHRARDQAFFWPWFERTASNALMPGAAPSAADVNARVYQTLRMQALYVQAHHHAIDYPIRERLSALPADCQTFASRPGDPLHLQCKALAKAQASRFVELPATVSAWPQAIAHASQ